MSATITTFPLLDGPLAEAEFVTSERAAVIYRMASDLLQAGTFNNYSDAMLTLVKAGHSRFNIMALIDDAIHVAVQHKVAMEMCQP